MVPRIHGRFADLGIPIRVGMFRGSGVPKDLAGELHRHDFVELLVFYGGSGIHRVADQDYPVLPGHVFVVTGNQHHAIRAREDLQHAEVHFNPGRLPWPGEHLGKMPGYRALFMLEPAKRGHSRLPSNLLLKPTELAHVLQLIQAMKSELTARSAGYEAALFGHLVRLVVFLSRQYSRSGTAEAKALLRVADLVQTLERNYPHPWRLEELAAQAHMSRSNLEKIFQEALGQSPIQYLIDVRLRHTQRLLQTTDHSITRIAQDVGFYDSNYLARKFREKLGLSPIAYRRSLA